MTSLRETISVVNMAETGAADAYGNPTMVEGASTSVPAAVSPLSSIELESGRDTRIQSFSILCSPDAAISGTSRLVWRGRQLEVIGEVKYFYVRGGALSHLEFEAREVVG